MIFNSKRAKHTTKILQNFAIAVSTLALTRLIVSITTPRTKAFTTRLNLEMFPKNGAMIQRLLQKQSKSAEKSDFLELQKPMLNMCCRTSKMIIKNQHIKKKTGRRQRTPGTGRRQRTPGTGRRQRTPGTGRRQRTPGTGRRQP